MIQDNEEKLRQFNQEWDQQYSTDDTKPPMDIGGSGNSNLLDSVKQGTANLAPNTAPYVPPAIPTTGDNCSQCGTMHPPIRPGETCPVAAEMKGDQPAPAPAQPAPAPAAPEKVVEAVVPESKPAPSPQAAEPVPGAPVKTVPETETVSEPTPLADNNIPTEIHVNKYLASWGQQIDIYCKNNNVKNVKKLMRHLTVEVTNFLDYYKEV